MTSRKQDVLKYCSYSALLLLVYVLQTSRGTSISPWGLQVDVLPYFVMTVALFEGPYAAGLFGFFAGMLAAVNSPTIDGLLATYYGVAGALGGLWAPSRMRRVAPSALLLGLIAAFVKGVFGYLFYYALLYNAPPGRAALLLLGEAAVSMLPAGLVYLAVRGICLRFSEKDES